MTEQDSIRFAKVMAALSETFNDSVSDVRADAYFAALDDLSIGAIEQAALGIMKRGRFFPKPVEIRESVEGTTEDNAELAWLGLLQEIRRVGYTGRPQLPPATMDVVQGMWGSWSALCQTLPGEGPELLGWAKRFGSAFGATSRRTERPELVGRAEAAALLDGVTERTGGLVKSFPAAGGRR